jgi:Glycosyl hydrolases family 2, TIM barrel domain/Glycosyl hydrolases family 2/Glycoside hydrolase family 2 C-terminal domain 5/Glycosyl hydrolases family 2, sugar binding domain
MSMTSFLRNTHRGAACLVWSALLAVGCGSHGSSAGQPGIGADGGTDGGTDSGAGEAGVPVVASGRVNLSFDTDWKYQQGDVPGADATAFADSAWAYVDLPHSTKFVTPEDPTAYLGVSWYRKHFTVDGAYQGNKLYIEFGAAMQQADVWVNGVHETQHLGGYAPFTIDVSGDALYGGADNVVSVRLDSRPGAGWAPGWEGVDFQYHGGLYRGVSLYATSLLHVTDAVFAGKVAGGGVFVTFPSVSAASATVAVTTNVMNESSAAKAATVSSQLLGSGGQVVASATSTSNIAAGADFDFAQNLVVANPSLWHPDTPNLYTLLTTVEDGAATVDQVTTRVGIRTIQWTHAGGLTINGARFDAIGVNMHQEMYGLGNAVPDQAIYFDVKRIKDGGMSFIRGSHYPHSPAFYDACDQLGVLVLDAQTGWQLYEDTPAFNASTYQELRDMIRRDRNHPSVVAWEASLNESNYTAAWARMANSIVHQEYPGDQAFSAQWMWASSDIVVGSSQASIRTSGDTRPIIVDEYGDYDYGGASSTSRQAREAGDNAMLIQAANVEDGTNLNLALPWYSAGSYWDYADYSGFTTYGITRCGLVDMYRLPKFAYYFLQSQRDPSVVVDGVDSGPMVYIANQWTATSPTTVRVYANCEQVSLSLNGALVATSAPPTTTSLFHPPIDFDMGVFTPGALRADCLIGDAVAASFTRQTPGPASTIRLRPEATTLRADLSDTRLVFIDVVDDSGTVVPTDGSSVTLSVSGPATIVGPAQVTMKGGQLATWVRAGRTAGTITLSANAAGLTAGSVTLTSEAVDGLPPAPADRAP